MKFPVFTGVHGDKHIQGIAIDRKNGFMYYSFTTLLIKSTLDGEVVGSVDGLTGHLGCIVFNEADGCIYGSLEYKNDAIGNGIRRSLCMNGPETDAFYIAIFEGNKIDRLNMHAEKDSIMTAVYLKEVVDDYNGCGANMQGEAVAHKYGCSGIDGTAIGPMPGSNNKKNYLMVAYGIYSDLTRADNDHQVILCYDLEQIQTYRRPLQQENVHMSGPSHPTKKFFVFTGNTQFGVQNLEYDPFTDSYFLAVYRGLKPTYPNYDVFVLDAATPPVKTKLKGLNEEGLLLPLKPIGAYHAESGVYGYRGPVGSTGLYAWGDGTYLAAQAHTGKTGQCGYIYQYVFDEKRGFVLNV